VLRHVLAAPSTQAEGRQVGSARPSAALTTLRDELAEAIRAEDYERAAGIRDEIRGLEAQVEDDA
jgi:protein-arginine kinase activator protein McsA